MNFSKTNLENPKRLISIKRKREDDEEDENVAC